MGSVLTQEFTIPNGSGRLVFCKSWRPDSSAVDRVIVMIHGLGEHLGRYDHWARKFCDSGSAFYALDTHGHGKTTGGRGHTESFSLIYDDIAELVARARRENPSAKIFLYGHSMGGCLALGATLNRELRIDALILTGPAIKPGFEPPAWKISLAKFLDRFLPALALGNELDIEGISSDPDVIKAYKNDPLVHDRISVRWFNEWLRAVDQILATTRYFKLPILIIHGANDKLTSPVAASLLAQSIGSHAKFHLWPGAKHEVHNEPCKDDVYRYIWQWMQTV